MQSENVQQVVSTYKRKSACLNEDFKTQVHPALCLLNTRQPCACVGVGHLRIVPTPAGNSRCGDLLSKLNLETASSHRFAGTWRAPLRRVLVIGHARKHPSHRPTVKENDSASMAQQRMDSRRDAKRVLGNSSSCANTRTHNPWQPVKAGSTPAASTKHCGFLSLSHFAGWRPFDSTGLPYFSLGGLSLLSALSLCFNQVLHKDMLKGG